MRSCNVGIFCIWVLGVEIIGMIPVEIGASSHKIQGHILKANILYNDVKWGKKLI